MPTLNLNFNRLRDLVLIGVFMVLVSGCTGTRSVDESVDVAVSEERSREIVGTLLRDYERKNLVGLMDRVSRDYLGDRARLERDLDQQLQDVDSIEYEWFISRVRPGESDQRIDVRFRWDRRWRDVDTGNETRQSGTTLFRLERTNDQYFLMDIQRANPFL